MKKVISIVLFLVVIVGGVVFGVQAASNLKSGDTAQKQVLPAESKSETAQEETTELKNLAYHNE